MTTRRSASLTALTVSVAVALTGCGTGADPGDEGLVVVATTSILGDIATQVVGEDGAVEVLMPIGVDAHDFAPSAQQASQVATADLVVANGLGLEAGLGDVLASAVEEGVVLIELAPLVQPIGFHHPDEEHEHGDLDPHFWMDPLRVGDAALLLAEELTDHHPGRWLERAAGYISDLETTDQQIEQLLDSIPGDRREMVTNHEAFGYFAERYRFEILGVVIPGGSTLADPSSAELAHLVAVMEQSGTRVIFAETTNPTTLAEAVASEVGEDVEVVELFTESLGGPGSEAETLAEMLLTNAGRISEALG